MDSQIQGESQYMSRGMDREVSEDSKVRMATAKHQIFLQCGRQNVVDNTGRVSAGGEGLDYQPKD